MATDRERKLFASNILTSIGQQATRLPASEITGFLAMSGEAYDGALMVVGRAVNGWTDGILPTALCIPGEADRYAALVQNSVARNAHCPMRWITASWGVTDSYNTRRSAFWRSVRMVVQGLGIANVEEEDWPSKLIWSNLYKVSPARGGNPNNVLCDIQFRGCAELLNLELHTYRPSRVLFLTGSDWAAPFLRSYKLRKTTEFQYVEQVGLNDSSCCVVAVHPQGKPAAVWASEVLRAFYR